MLFNTFAFFLGFLPLALAGYTLLSRFSLRGSVAFLFIASCVFYSYWDIAYLPLLLASIAVNYTLGTKIARAHEQHAATRGKRFLQAGIIFNLGLLAFFKYWRPRENDDEHAIQLTSGSSFASVARHVFLPLKMK